MIKYDKDDYDNNEYEADESLDASATNNKEDGISSIFDLMKLPSAKGKKKKKHSRIKSDRIKAVDFAQESHTQDVDADEKFDAFLAVEKPLEQSDTSEISEGSAALDEPTRQESSQKLLKDTSIAEVEEAFFEPAPKEDEEPSTEDPKKESEDLFEDDQEQEQIERDSAKKQEQSQSLDAAAANSEEVSHNEKQEELESEESSSIESAEESTIDSLEAENSSNEDPSEINNDEELLRDEDGKDSVEEESRELSEAVLDEDEHLEDVIDSNDSTDEETSVSDDGILENEMSTETIEETVQIEMENTTSEEFCRDASEEEPMFFEDLEKGNGFVAASVFGDTESFDDMVSIDAKENIPLQEETEATFGEETDSKEDLMFFEDIEDAKKIDKKEAEPVFFEDISRDESKSENDKIACDEENADISEDETIHTENEGSSLEKVDTPKSNIDEILFENDIEDVSLAPPVDSFDNECAYSKVESYLSKADDAFPIDLNDFDNASAQTAQEEFALSQNEGIGFEESTYYEEPNEYFEENDAYRDGKYEYEAEADNDTYEHLNPDEEDFEEEISEIKEDEEQASHEPGDTSVEEVYDVTEHGDVDNLSKDVFEMSEESEKEEAEPHRPIIQNAFGIEETPVYFDKCIYPQYQKPMTIEEDDLENISVVGEYSGETLNLDLFDVHEDYDEKAQDYEEPIANDGNADEESVTGADTEESDEIPNEEFRDDSDDDETQKEYNEARSIYEDIEDSSEDLKEQEFTEDEYAIRSSEKDDEESLTTGKVVLIVVLSLLAAVVIGGGIYLFVTGRLNTIFSWI